MMLCDSISNPCKPNQNAVIEHFNRSLREGVLDQYFQTLRRDEKADIGG